MRSSGNSGNGMPLFKGSHSFLMDDLHPFLPGSASQICGLGLAGETRAADLP